jgi:hypothetical protein
MKRPEGWSIAGEYAKDSPALADLNLAFHARLEAGLFDWQELAAVYWR